LEPCTRRISESKAALANYWFSCGFGGDDLEILYVTSSTALVPAAERESQKHAGALLAIHALGAKGLPEPLFEG
jgi:L-arabinonolactonase